MNLQKALTIAFPVWAILMLSLLYSKKEQYTQVEYLNEPLNASTRPSLIPYGYNYGMGAWGGGMVGGSYGGGTAQIALAEARSIDSINCEEQAKTLKQVLKLCTDSNTNSQRSAINSEDSLRETILLKAQVSLQNNQLKEANENIKNGNQKIDGLLKQNKNKDSLFFLVQILVSILGTLFLGIKFKYLKIEQENKSSIFAEMVFSYVTVSLIPLLNLFS